MKGHKDMQQTLTQKETKARQEAREFILHYTLLGVLEDGEILALNTQLGILSLIGTGDHDTPRLLMQQQFTVGEMSVFTPLIENFPYYCSYEVLLAGFNGNWQDEDKIAKAKERLDNATENGTWDVEIRGVRTVLSRARFKLRLMGFDILSILETGYILRRLPTIKQLRISQ